MVNREPEQFEFEQQEAFGVVESVDTSTVIISIDKEDAISHIQVNRLVAIQSIRIGEYYIGMISKIVRKADTQSALTNENELTNNNVKVILVGTFHCKVGLKTNVFTRSIVSVPTINAEAYLIEKHMLSLLMGSLANQSSESTSCLDIGHYAIDKDTPAFIDGDKFFQRHAVIVGSTGSGKSWLVARIAEQVADLKSGDAILFDIHGEYASLTGNGFCNIRIAGPNDEPSDDVLFLPFWLLTYDELISLMLDRSDQNAPNQAALFSQLVLEGKQDFLIDGTHDSESSMITLDSPIPFDINLLIETLKEKDRQMVPGANGKEKQGPYFGKLTRFTQRLNTKIRDKRLNFLFSSSSKLMQYSYMTEITEKLMAPKGVSQGVKVIDFSDVPSDILPLIASLVARLIFTVQQWTKNDSRHPIALFCDEAHLYIPANTSEVMGLSARASFERIAKEGRKYGVSLVVITQRPFEVDKTVLSQCNNFLSMRLTNADDQNTIKHLLPDTLGNLTDSLPILDTGEAIVVGDACLLPSRIMVGIPKHKPISTTIDFWSTWNNEANTIDYTKPVQSLRLQRKD